MKIAKMYSFRCFSLKKYLQFIQVCAFPAQAAEKTQRLRASGPLRNIFSWIGAASVQLAELLQNRRTGEKTNLHQKREHGRRRPPERKQQGRLHRFALIGAARPVVFASTYV